jgi:2,6-dihydroxypseudooxynicotine hydrolase
LTAAGHYTRAAVCYHFGKFLFVIDPAQMKQAHMKSVECRNRALPHLVPPGERVAIPYEGKQLYGNLRKPAGDARAPIVVMCMGLDSAKEEMNDYEERFLVRGLATLAFDGPGQGEAEYDFAICPEYEKPVKAVFDWLETRRDIDPKRAGIWGVSLGGYYAPRAAAFERRVKACVASGPMRARTASRPTVDQRGISAARAPRSRRRARWRCACRSRAWRGTSPARSTSSPELATASHRTPRPRSSPPRSRVRACYR